MTYTANDHTFAVCAYKESPYLEECLISLKKQDIQTNIIVATSTPCEHITKICNRQNVSLLVRDGASGIAPDWNFALASAKTSLVTLAHQDDVYAPSYSSIMLQTLNKAKNPLIFLCDYGELREGEFIDNNQLLTIKRKLLKPLRPVETQSSYKIKRKILSLGNPICCPAVTFVIPNEGLKFNDKYKSNLDWEMWANLAEKQGSFAYKPIIGMYHRIHEESETSALIHDDTRTKEDRAMLEKFWPKPIAAAINLIYSRGQKSNG